MADRHPANGGPAMGSCKQCTKCHSVKPLTEFHKRKDVKDGRVSSCKACQNTRSAAYRAAHVDEQREYRAANADRYRAWQAANADRLRTYKAAWHVANRERRKAAAAAYRAVNGEKVRIGIRHYQIKYPERIAANRAVRRALATGQLSRPTQCSRCGLSSDLPIEGHHEDYSKHLEVTWLCRACHRKRHATLNRRTA